MNQANATTVAVAAAATITPTIASTATTMPRRFFSRRLIQRTTSPAIRTKHPAGAGRGLCEEHGDGDADEAEADERPGPVTALGEHPLRERLVAPLFGDHQHGGEVDEDPRAAEQREDDEPEPEDGGAEVEVPAETACNAGDDPR